MIGRPLRGLKVTFDSLWATAMFLEQSQTRKLVYGVDTVTGAASLIAMLRRETAGIVIG